FTGHPVVALIISVLFACWSLGLRCGWKQSDVLRFTEVSIASVGMTLLVVGGGGGFARVLRDCGTADALAAIASKAELPPMIYGWLIAVLVRIATGSATVAASTAASLAAPMLLASPNVHPELAVVAIGCGSLILSHLNDGGFWMLKEGYGLTVGQTIRTWTWAETMIGFAGALIAWGISLLLPGRSIIP
ncbi:MAG: permease DsdX, partial [Verrucomicrobia bacterium]|nr:permease DsdX [Verrucomicrobiota bacterium]